VSAYLRYPVSSLLIRATPQMISGALRSRYRSRPCTSTTSSRLGCSL
jgi:hypothetical protein